MSEQDTTLDEFVSLSEDENQDQVWEEYQLRELVEQLQAGGTPDTDREEYYEGDIPWVKTGELGQLEINSTEQTITEQGLEESTARLFPPATVLIAMYGATTGEVSMLDTEATTNQACCGIIPDESLLPHYLYYQLVHGKKQLESLSAGSGQQNISKSILEKFRIPVASLEEQRKIATVLYNVDQAIQKTEEIIEQIQVVKEGVRQECIPSGVGEHNYESIRVGPKEVNIPSSWEYKSLSDVCEKVTDGTHETPEVLDEGYPLITSEDTVEGEIDFSSDKYISEEEHQKVMRRSKPEQGDILFTHIGKNTGKVAKVDVDFEFSIKNVALFKPDLNQIDSSYLKAYLRSSIVRDFVARQLQGGAQDFLSLTELNKMPVLLPPEHEQVEIAEIISSVKSSEDNEKEIKSRLSRLKQGLMQDLLSGKVRTTDTNIEVPDEITQHG